MTIPFGGVLVDRIGHATALMVASLGLFGFGVTLLSISPSLPLTAFIGAVFGLPAGAIMVLPGEVLLPQNRATGMGIFFSWYYVGMALLTPIAGFLRDATGKPSVPIFFGAGLAVAAIAFLILLRLGQRRNNSHS